MNNGPDVPPLAPPLHVTVRHNARRAFVCGDVHGCLDVLQNALFNVDFDPAQDHLYALGDLVDRGPNSPGVMALLRKPWFSSIMGNHEQMLAEAAKGHFQSVRHHVENGGEWYVELEPDVRQALATEAAALPVAMTVVCPGGTTVGLVHAVVPGSNWTKFTGALEDRTLDSSVIDYAMWNRDLLLAAVSGKQVAPVRGVDRVFYGHTPLSGVLRVHNMAWIDLGSYATGKVHLEQIW